MRKTSITAHGAVRKGSTETLSLGRPCSDCLNGSASVTTRIAASRYRCSPGEPRHSLRGQSYFAGGSPHQTNGKPFYQAKACKAFCNLKIAKCKFIILGGKIFNDIYIINFTKGINQLLISFARKNKKHYICNRFKALLFMNEELMLHEAEVISWLLLGGFILFWILILIAIIAIIRWIWKKGNN